MASTDSELRERSAAGGSNASPSSAQTPQGNEGKRAGGGGGGRGPPADLLTSIVRLLHWGVLQIFQTVFSLNVKQPPDTHTLAPGRAVHWRAARAVLFVVVSNALCSTVHP